MNCTPAQTQRCDVIQKEIFSKCKQKIGDGHVAEYLNSCKIDACAYRNNTKVLDKVICKAIEGFARECELAGFPLDWRGVSKCGKKLLIYSCFYGFLVTIDKTVSI